MLGKGILRQERKQEGGDGVIYMTSQRMDRLIMELLGCANRPCAAVPRTLNESGTREAALSLNLERDCQPENPSAAYVSMQLDCAGLVAYAATPGFYKGAEDLNTCPYVCAVSDLCPEPSP